MKINVIIKNQPSDEAIKKTAQAIGSVFDKIDIVKYNRNEIAKY